MIIKICDNAGNYGGRGTVLWDESLLTGKNKLRLLETKKGHSCCILIKCSHYLTQLTLLCKIVVLKKEARRTL
jgi:hypothetical protein